MHALPTPAKLFTPAVIALCLLLTACFGSDPPPTRESNRTPAQTNEALQAQLQELQTQTANAILSGSPDGTQTQRPTTPAAPNTVTTELPALTKTPVRTKTPTAQPTSSPHEISADANICKRPPALQERLLGLLKIPLCSAATNEELFRVTTLTVQGGSSYTLNLPTQTVAQGTFHGLTNLTTLKLRAGAVGPRAFEGLRSLQELTITVRDGHISHEAFADLPTLRTLHISLQQPDEPQNQATKTVHQERDEALIPYPSGTWTSPGQLRDLTIRYDTSSLTLDAEATPLAEFQTLKSLYISTAEYPAFATELLTLTTLTLETDHDSRKTPAIPSSFHELAPSLESLTLKGYWRVHQNALNQLQNLQFNEGRPGTGESHQLTLHPDSPAYQKARYDRSPSYVDVVNLPK